MPSLIPFQPVVTLANMVLDGLNDAPIEILEIVFDGFDDGHDLLLQKSEFLIALFVVNTEFLQPIIAIHQASQHIGADVF